MRRLMIDVTICVGGSTNSIANFVCANGFQFEHTHVRCPPHLTKNANSNSSGRSVFDVPRQITDVLN